MPDSQKISEKQSEYMNLIAEIMDIRKRGEKPVAYIRTYGCQQNVADSEKIKGMLEQSGFEFSDEPDNADFILFNTCAVREHAEDRVFGNVGALKNLKRKHPQILIALCGCMMEQEHVANKIYKSFPFVGLVFGTHSLHHFPELMYNALLDGKRVFERGNDDNQLYEGFPIKRDGTFKGWLPIMYGCNNFCTYCVVPYVRGRERSREKNIIVSEAKNMIESGYKDITLLGQNVNSYGKGLSEKVNFSQLLREVDSIDGDYWLRFMTSHPKDCSRELIDTIASGTHISKHLHLPFQCGSDRVLKAMNRHYDRRKYLEIINYAKEKIDGLSLTSDIIVGFPGETYEDFKETLSLMKPSAFIINTSRGALIDEAALIEALKNGTIAGAGLDVQETEPPEENSPLYTMDHVLLTPHMGWKGLETRQRLVSILADNIKKFTEGNPINVVSGLSYLAR